MKKTITAEEVAKHNRKDDLWFIVSGKVYDVTKFQCVVSSGGSRSSSRRFHSSSAVFIEIPMSHHPLCGNVGRSIPGGRIFCTTWPAGTRRRSLLARRTRTGRSVA